MAYKYGQLIERLQGAELKFIIDGEVIDLATISASVPPDLADFGDSDNDDYRLGFVSNAKYAPETQDQKRKHYRPGAGWKQVSKPIVLTDAFEVTMKDFATGLYDRLMFGLAAAPVNNTAQTIAETSRRYVEGWILFNFYEADDGSDVHSGQAMFHARLSLATAAEIKDEEGSPVWRIEILGDGGAADTYKPYPTPA